MGYMLFDGLHYHVLVEWVCKPNYLSKDILQQVHMCMSVSETKRHCWDILIAVGHRASCKHSHHNRFNEQWQQGNVLWGCSLLLSDYPTRFSFIGFWSLFILEENTQMGKWIFKYLDWWVIHLHLPTLIHSLVAEATGPGEKPRYPFARRHISAPPGRRKGVSRPEKYNPSNELCIFPRASSQWDVTGKPLKGVV